MDRQDENRSDINGRRHPRKWWHWAPGNPARSLPLVLVDEPLGDAERWLHWGWDKERDTPGAGPVDPRNLDAVGAQLRALAKEAFCQQRLPAIDATDPAAAVAVRKRWPSGLVVELSQARPKLRELCDYPWNGLFDHPWLPMEARKGPA